MPRRNPLPKAPPKRRMPGQSSTARQDASALARVRRFSSEHERTERPFDPSRAPSWRGSSRDLVVNGGRRRARRNGSSEFELQEGYGFEQEFRSGNDWQDAPDEEWETVMVGPSEVAVAAYVGSRLIDGTPCAVFDVDSHFFAQSKVNARRKSAIDPRDIPEHLTPIKDWGYKEEGPSENGENYGYSNTRFGKNKADSNGWFQVEYATYSDYSGSSAERSNYRVLSQMLEEAHPADAQPVVWARTYGGHGTKGLIVNYGDLDEEVRETIDGLEDYPLASEEDNSELEMEEQNEAWDNWGKSDFIEQVAKLTGKDRSALEDAISSEQWWQCLHLAMEASNTYWEDQGMGGGPYVDMKKMAEELNTWLDGEYSDKYPKYSNEYDDEALDALRAALPNVEND